MSRFNAGDRVVATKNIGGFLRDAVDKGTHGVVTKAGWGQLRVLFTIHGFFGDHQVEMDVSEDEIA